MNMSAPSQEKPLHREIAELERRLQEKREALAREGRVLEEKEAFRETFYETYGDALQPEVAPPQPSAAPRDRRGAPPPAPATQAAQEQLEVLIALAFTKGVRAATEAARRATPWLMDELHDELVDRYYEHLIQLKQLKAL